jgi:hypothetical protein
MAQLVSGGVDTVRAHHPRHEVRDTMRRERFTVGGGHEVAGERRELGGQLGRHGYVPAPATLAADPQHGAGGGALKVLVAGVGQLGAAQAAQAIGATAR